MKRNGPSTTENTLNVMNNASEQASNATETASEEVYSLIEGNKSSE